MPPSRPRILLAALLASLVATLALPSTSLAAGATIGAVDCDAGGAVVTLRNETGGPARFTVMRDERAVATAVLPAGAGPVTRIVPIAEGAAATVTVRFGGSYVSALARRVCVAPGAGAVNGAPVQAAASAATPTPVVPGTGVRGATDAAPTEPAVDADEVTLADPATSWPLLLAAALALSIVAALLLGGRLRSRRRQDELDQAPAARPHA